MNEVEDEQDFYGGTQEQARRRLCENPGLKPQLNGIPANAYDQALMAAEWENRRSRNQGRATLPWFYDQAVSGDVRPEYT